MRKLVKIMAVVEYHDERADDPLPLVDDNEDVLTVTSEVNEMVFRALMDAPMEYVIKVLVVEPATVVDVEMTDDIVERLNGRIDDLDRNTNPNLN